MPAQHERADRFEASDREYFFRLTKQFRQQAAQAVLQGDRSTADVLDRAASITARAYRIET